MARWPERPEPAPAGLPDVDALRSADRRRAGQAAATTQPRNCCAPPAFTLEGATVRIEVPGIGKKMLALTVNAAAEKIIRQELQRLGAPSRFLAVPGEGSCGFRGARIASLPPPAAFRRPRWPIRWCGRAREIFHAEVRSVVDLRRK